ncbi:UPF0721 transmembrane protein [Spirochaetia bacterium]|nr:UPF0721 transmembrane protein [Spirochaetia bacterium]
MDFISANLVTIIYVLLVVFAIGILIVFIRDFVKFKKEHGLEKEASWVKSGGLGFLTNFFDTLGIGSFAPTTAGLRLLKQCDDKLIPGILNIGCAIPVIFEAILFIREVAVEPITLGGMLLASVIGAYLGAGIVAKLDRQYIRITMGVALIIAAFLMIAGLPWVGWGPTGGEAVGLTGGKLVIAIGANFVLGALMTAGIGLYGPCMALVYVLGMSPRVAFPIMMGSCALLMPVASIKFIKEGVYGRKSAMAINIFGVVGVAVAFWIVKSMPLDILRVLVILVLLYTAISFLYSFAKDRKGAKA